MYPRALLAVLTLTCFSAVGECGVVVSVDSESALNSQLEIRGMAPICPLDSDSESWLPDANSMSAVDCQLGDSVNHLAIADSRHEVFDCPQMMESGLEVAGMVNHCRSSVFRPV